MEEQTLRGENAMAGRSEQCAALAAYYGLPPQSKRKYVETDAARALLEALPNEIADKLIEGFLGGTAAEAKVIEYFRAHSRIVPDLAEYPGTFTMLEKMYSFERIAQPIDIFFSASLPGGVSLESRFHKVNEMAALHINEILAHRDNCIVLDLGSGPGRNGIALTLAHPELKSRVEFHGIDTDPKAIAFGQRLAAEHGLDNIRFIDKSMTRLHKLYRGTADYGLIIGVLCGLSIEERVGLLKIMRPYFRPDSRVVGAGLLDRMLELDLFCSYILRETAGWILQHPPLGAIKQSFEAAGYAYEGYFQEEPSRCYEIGIGRT